METPCLQLKGTTSERGTVPGEQPGSRWDRGKVLGRAPIFGEGLGENTQPTAGQLGVVSLSQWLLISNEPEFRRASKVQ